MSLVHLDIYSEIFIYCPMCYLNSFHPAKATSGNHFSLWHQFPQHYVLDLPRMWKVRPLLATLQTCLASVCDVLFAFDNILYTCNMSRPLVCRPLVSGVTDLYTTCKHQALVIMCTCPDRLTYIYTTWDQIPLAKIRSAQLLILLQ